jgi:transposase-like protein
LSVVALPEKCRPRLRTTNMQERLNKKIRRREGVIRIFPKLVPGWPNTVSHEPGDTI